MKPSFRFIRLLLYLGTLVLAGCIYRMDIPQGNRIDPATVEQLELGMTRNQVRFLLGTPAVLDPMRPDEWHYIYYMKTGNNKAERRNMMLSFTGDSLTRIEGSLNPG